MLNSFKSFKILFSILIILLLLKFLTDYFYSNASQSNPKDDINSETIESIFLSSLNNFEISEKLIQREIDKEKIRYKVKVYSDLPIEMILLELERNFSDKNVELINKDAIPYQKSLCNIYSNGEIKLEAELSVDKSLTRNKGSISFLVKINNPDQLNKEIIESSEPISFLIVPDRSLQQNVISFKKNNRKYFILINPEIKDLVYKLNNNNSEKQVINTINRTLKDFENSSRIYIYSDGSWLNSRIIETISRQVKKEKKSLFYTKEFTDLSESDEDISFEIIEDLSRMSPQQKRIYIITSEQYVRLHKYFPSFRKSGFRIVSITELQ